HHNHTPRLIQVLHRVDRVDDQVDENLLQLDVVGLHRQGHSREHTAYGDPARMRQSRHEIEDVADHVVEIDLPGLEWRAHEQAAQAADHFAGALVVAPDVRNDFL